jgi:thiamine-monophosphate kinase
MDEYAIIRLLTRTAGDLPRGYLPIGDDVAVLPGKRSKLILKSDMLVAKTDVPPGMTWRQAGRKSVAMCVSDFAAKGVSPEAFMVSLGIPRSLPDDDIKSLAEGFGDGMKEWGVSLVGGDTNEADDVIVDCVMAGFADRIVKRSGAKPGELVVVTGEFGTTSAGLKILLEGARADPVFRKHALANVYRPSPKLRLGLALSRYLSSAMDSSDGLAICLHTIAEMSGVGMRIEKLPHSGSGLEKFAVQNGYRVDDLVLYGGEEYEIVATISKEEIDEAQRVASSVGARLLVIGEITSGTGVATSDGREIRNKGWVYFA